MYFHIVKSILVSMTLLPVEYVYVVQCYNQWRSEGRAWPGTCPANVRRVVPLVARDVWVRALVLLAQWLSVQQVPGQYQWPGYSTGYNPTTSYIQCYNPTTSYVFKLGMHYAEHLTTHVQ